MFDLKHFSIWTLGGAVVVGIIYLFERLFQLFLINIAFKELVKRLNRRSFAKDLERGLLQLELAHAAFDNDERRKEYAKRARRLFRGVSAGAEFDNDEFDDTPGRRFRATAFLGLAAIAKDFEPDDVHYYEAVQGALGADASFSKALLGKDLTKELVDLVPQAQKSTPGHRGWLRFAAGLSISMLIGAFVGFGSEKLFNAQKNKVEANCGEASDTPLTSRDPDRIWISEGIKRSGSDTIISEKSINSDCVVREGSDAVVTSDTLVLQGTDPVKVPFSPDIATFKGQILKAGTRITVIGGLSGEMLLGKYGSGYLFRAWAPIALR